MPDWLFWILVVAGGIAVTPLIINALIFLTVAITAIVVAFKK